MNFIERYADLMEKLTDAPREYQEACALYLISTFAGRQFVFLSIPDMDIFGGDPSGGKYLNMWFILIGKSRILRKTTVIKRARELGNIIDPELLLADDFTPQALIKTMNRKVSGGVTRATWINDEISGFFEQLVKADFMAATDTTLSRIYDCASYTRETIIRGTESITNPYLTALFASTEYLPTLFEESMIRQGFLNRFIYIPSEKEKRMSLKTSMSQQEKDEAQEILEWLQAVYNRYLHPAILIIIDKGARPAFDAFEDKIEDRIKNEDLGMGEGYWGNLPNFLVRVASLHRIARMTKQEIDIFDSTIQPFLLVETEDISYAEQYCWKIWDWFERTVDLMSVGFRDKGVLVERKEINSIFRIIEEIIDDPNNPNDYAPRSKVLTSSGFKAKRLNEIISTLIVQERIEQELLGGSGGRPTVVYRIIE